MKKYFLLGIIFFAGKFLIAQKTKPKEKIPTQAEVQRMMNMMQKELNNISSEDKKMMDSLGIKMPNMRQMKKNMAGVNDAQLKQAYEDDMRIVSKKDAARIAAIQPTPANEPALSVYLQTVLNKIIAVMKPAAKEAAEELYAGLHTEYNAADIGNAAVGLWMAGKNELAVYVMCRACREDVTNTDNINNLSAMLVMNSGEQLAIPLLNYINKKFSGNSTILNNLGQAWFCLGDIPKAEKYLDSTVRIYAMHPQANFTKSFIEEQKGNKTEAVNLIHKSLQYSFSDDKLERLKMLGDDMKAGDINLPPKTKQDPLNLGGFTHPDFPKSVDECFILKPQWDAFRESIDAESERLRKMYEDAMQLAGKKQEERTNDDIAMVQESLAAGSPQGTFTSLPLYIHKAVPKLKAVTDEYNAKMERWTKKATGFMEGKGLDLRKSYQAEMQRLRDEDGEQTGEGRPNKDYCPRYKETTDNFLRAYNTETEQLYIERLEITKAFLNEMTYYSMYTNWPEMFEAIKLQSKMSWLGTLYAQAPNNFEYNMDFVCNKGEDEKKNSELAEFDDVACQYHSEMNLIVYKIKTDCSRMTTELDTKFIKLKLKQDMDKETFADKFMQCNVEFRASVGEKVKLGPVEAGVKLTGGAGFEFNRKGLSDAYLIGGVSAKVGGVGGGTEGRFSIMSGPSSFKGTGMFKRK